MPDSGNTYIFAFNAEIWIKDKDEADEESQEIVFDTENYLKLEIKSSSENLNSKDDKNSANIQEIEDLLKMFLTKNLKEENFQIKDKVYWRVYCDIFVLGSLFLNEFNYLIKGIKTGLVNCKFPKTQISKNNWNDEYSYEIIEGQTTLFTQQDLPSIFLIGENQGNIVMDMSLIELHAVNSFYIVAYDKQGVL